MSQMIETLLKEREEMRTSMRGVVEAVWEDTGHTAGTARNLQLAFANTASVPPGLKRSPRATSTIEHQPHSF